MLLLPGGAEATLGFFPGLIEGLVADPGCHVIVHDRPGTGTSTLPGALADAPAHLNELITEVGLGPAVVVGQSLGGAVAVLLAQAHPENVAGLVLLDPTPINDPTLCSRIERMTRTLAALDRVPVVRGLIAAGLRASVARSTRNLDLRPECRAVFDRTANLDIPQLDRTVHGLAELSATLAPKPLPSVLITADRKPGAAITQAHTRLADALGATLRSFPGADHNVQLTHPDETLAATRALISELR
ncbi:alpha/beta fold hydrolase [Kribbella sandramycini]|uniref:Pimeloyl-ACP methyl ester carboxylesterase n=1 Tax=Kribbella sandramycini TaxID=60450 RepID=A0A841SKB5_9ACTN|nr:pimeloyl-ACP methyl ester carboxylesterase [Kribbella sandramycini]